MKQKSKLEKLKSKKKLLELLSSFMFIPLVSLITSAVSIFIVVIISKLIGLYDFETSIYFLVILFSVLFTSLSHGLVRYNSLKKLEDIELEITSLENGNRPIREKTIDEIRVRFEGLSSENKIKLLEFIRDNLMNITNIEQIDDLKDTNVMILMDKLNDIQLIKDTGNYCKKRFLIK